MVPCLIGNASLEISKPNSFRDESLGPEDVQMSRCMENLGVHFVDTRDKFGKLRLVLQILEIGLVNLG